MAFDAPLTILTSSLKNFAWLKRAVRYRAIAAAITIGPTTLGAQFHYQASESAPDR
jgi:hypothetical protein